VFRLTVDKLLAANPHREVRHRHARFWIRTDFSELFMVENVFPIRDIDSRLRKTVLNKTMMP
jgi:hypothetical protein